MFVFGGCGSDDGGCYSQAFPDSHGQHLSYSFTQYPVIISYFVPHIVLDSKNTEMDEK